MAEPEALRQKYFDALDREQAREDDFKAVEELLRRIASRLCIAARGQSGDLDAGLLRVGNAMRSPATVAILQPLLNELSGAIARLDEGGARPPAPSALPPPALFVRLLDRIAVRGSLQPAAARLRTDLLARDAEAVLPELAQRLADLVNRQAADVQRERLELERMLQHLNGRLADLGGLLGDDAAERRAAHDDGRALSSELLGQVQELGTSVTEASDLAWLQQRVRGRLDAIAGALHAQRARDEERHARLELKSSQLHARVAELEAEGARLRDSLQREQAAALTDALTEIPNRLAYQERIARDYERWKRYGQPLSLAAWDVDRFKSINDTWGHAAGDKVLRKLGQHLARSIRQSDFVARYGGEEFVLILDGVDARQALACAEKLREGVARLAFHHAQTPVPVTVSCGLTELRAGDTLESAFERADQALYRAKKEGRNRCVVA